MSSGLSTVQLSYFMLPFEQSIAQNIVVERVKLLLLNHWVRSSDLSSKTSHTDWGFFQSQQADVMIIPQIRW
jgi:hypothetical protein